MRRMSDLPIRWKLVVVTIVTSAIVELLAVAAIILYVGQNYRVQKAREFAVQAEVLAASLTAPLAFGDREATREYLSALQANQEITAAGAYRADGKLLASYLRAGTPPGLLPTAQQPAGERIRGPTLTVSQPVAHAGSTIGSIYLVVDVDTLMTQLARFSGLILLAVFGSLAIAVPISIQMTAAISNAIREIAGAASRIKAGELDIDIPPTTRTDEIGVLISTFRQMVASLRDMMQQERLRALGQMSSGIAHDINNAMSPVALYTDSLLESEPDLSPRTRSYLETVKRVVADVTATVGRMRDFSRKREPEMTLAPVALNKVIGQVVELTRARWSNMQQQRGGVIAVKTELLENLPIVMGIEGEIREALTNLIFNAVDAMPEGGTLILRTKVTDDASPPSHVEVEVSDTGTGMDDETRRRCFEPFFTTKGERGTGLGMAMVYGVVQRHSAEIAIDSAPGKGTTVRLTFLARAPIAAEPTTAKAVAMPTSPLRILIVDDDPHVLESMSLVLELDGHDVVAANGGQEGIDTFRARLSDGKTFAVVITDLGMPYVDGNQVARAIKEASSSTPIILLTGWGRRMTAEGEAPQNVDFVLGKPPDLSDLRAALAECANRKSA